MKGYEEALKGLNRQQRQAVEHIDGPLLVIAGPGTGKTQLLSVRVAHILQQTDTLPQNILCLTFTESGAENMRERLTRFIGQAAYDVNIGTYHAFGGELIRRFPEIFAQTRLQAPADELAKRQILRSIVEDLSYSNPLKQVRHHLGDLVSTISEVKRALLDADSLRAIARENTQFIEAASQAAADAFAGWSLMPRSLAKAQPPFEQLLTALQGLAPAKATHSHFGSLADIAASSLTKALQAAAETGKTTPLTKWKNTWLAKNDNNSFIFEGTLVNRRIGALADVFEAYQNALATNGWYDFDDMILRAIQALEQHPDLRYSLQEQYLYLLLDEFQDTNAAQLRLVQLLSNNPVHEGRPNILAVGDDDQAIYAFQGAQYSNMLDFYRMYRDVKIINLTDNYRSSADILTVAQAVSAQIKSRLETHFQDLNKELRAANPRLPAQAHIERREFLSDVAQYDWIATQIHALIQEGTAPSEIAVLAPKHRQLEPLIPYLAELDVPMRYEKRENILEAPIIRQLLSMSKLVLALQANNHDAANALWPEVLSFDFWHIPTSELWQLSWKVSDAKRESGLTWSQALLSAEQSYFRQPALLMLHLAGRVQTETCEQLLDQLIGTDAVTTGEEEGGVIRSPLREFYTSEEVQRANPSLFYDALSHLTVLRARLRDYQATQTAALTLADLITFVEMYEEAEERMLNTSPYNQQANAVQLMTVFKAKGLEFEHVFLPCMQDEVWGSSSRGNTNKLTLPTNLAPIRHAGATDDERLRIFFVALTRAKHGLHLTSFARTFSGKTTKRLKYLDEQEQPDGGFKSMVLPGHAQTVLASDHQPPTLKTLEQNWRQRHLGATQTVQLRNLLAPRLTRYQLSPTHLTAFIDLEYCGPQQFFLNNLLCFPQAPTINSRFGNAIHATLEWLQHRINADNALPPLPALKQYFAKQLQLCMLTKTQYLLELERGEKALEAYLAQRGHIFKPGDTAEQNFRNENVFLDEAHLAGKVDRMEIDRAARVITVVDYKTGRSYTRWASEAKLHKYRLQLYAYKLLIENSRTYKGFSVQKGRLEFVEPDAEGRIHHLELTFSPQEEAHVRQLLVAMWQRVQALDFPDVTTYGANLAGIKQFEADLIGDPTLL